MHSLLKSVDHQKIVSQKKEEEKVYFASTMYNVHFFIEIYKIPLNSFSNHISFTLNKLKSEVDEYELSYSLIYSWF